MKVVSLFSGCGGLDIGFSRAGFDVIWANEYDKNIWDTFEVNHPKTHLDKRNVKKIPSSEIPDCIGVIGGPPCQSWSTAGKRDGIKDPRGRLFFEFVRIVNDKEPLFFVAENVTGILAPRHADALALITESLESAGSIGYNLSYSTLDAYDYGVPQHRKRVIFVGYRKDLIQKYTFPVPVKEKKKVEDVLKDLAYSAAPSIGNRTNRSQCTVDNHEYLGGSFSYIYMSRNRVLSWDKPSFTVQASGRQISLHPNSPKMIPVKKDVMRFELGKENQYRRLSIRECARLQTFPDTFTFKYENLKQAYKMVGNAVPVELAYHIGKSIVKDLVCELLPNTVANEALVYQDNGQVAI